MFRYSRVNSRRFAEDTEFGIDFLPSINRYSKEETLGLEVIRNLNQTIYLILLNISKIIQDFLRFKSKFTIPSLPPNIYQANP